MSPCWRPIGKQNFDDDICLITGAAQGLGRLLALKLAERYAVLVLLDVKEEKLKEVINNIVQNLDYFESLVKVHIPSLYRFIAKK